MILKQKFKTATKSTTNVVGGGEGKLFLKEGSQPILGETYKQSCTQVECQVAIGARKRGIHIRMGGGGGGDISHASFKKGAGATQVQ